MIETFTLQTETIEVNTGTMEAYFKRDDLGAKVIKDDLGYFCFAHPLWLTQYRMIVKDCFMSRGKAINEPSELEVLEWHQAR